MTEQQAEVMVVETGQDTSLQERTTVSRHDSMSSSPIPEDLSMDRSSETSWSSAAEAEARGSVLDPKLATLRTRLGELFAENITAKICRTATTSLPENPDVSSDSKIPIAFPETVPQTGPNAGRYELREPDFWTCGFFPGTLYTLLERSIKHPEAMNISNNLTISSLRSHLQSLCHTWSLPLHAMASRTDTHDIGFIIMPALRRSFELTSDASSLSSIILAARSLATRYIPSAAAIRSWDCLLKKDITVIDTETNLLVIIDSLCNLDLLFYASSHSGDASLADIATAHARTLLRTHLRPEPGAKTLNRDGYAGMLYSTCHVANLDPATGELMWRRTAQGYADGSTWARGQAWAILGYAQTYRWTGGRDFLEAACGAAEYFLYRLETSPSCVEVPISPGRTAGRMVPLWDFDAPIEDASSDPLRDSSAGVIAANGMLILSQCLRGTGQHALARRFCDAAVDVVADTLEHSLATEKTRFTRGGVDVEDVVPGSCFDGLLKNGTANNNENARRRYANHGLVYGDYYLVEFGNRLLEMGLV
ncbi:unsaturated glucuronyl hydrolase [Colletotrichum sojae]|uniref:Unsaturated glucuronyl hydrolase n=1 Tax=Colletotrichum sojae TaxID=2175907 RepID=A0A8H6IZK3_9PEZI|nr:unsaturated glucuronyl hydrolase [Colletotrichum sojae]